MPRFLLKASLVLLASAAFTTSYAYEVKDVCASYQTNYSWSRTQPATVQIHSGMDLQRSAGLYANIDMFAHYVIVPFKSGDVAVIKINDFYTQGAMMFQTQGVDGNGRAWRFSDNATGYCI